MLIWNAEDILERSLRATLPYVKEAHVIDSGSTDKTMEILAKVKKDFSILEYTQENVQHLGELWTGSRKDFALTSLLNKLKKKTKSSWILKADDDEIFPDFLMKEILDLEPTEDYYSIAWHHVMGENADTTYKRYYLRNAFVLRLFKNIPEITWDGHYGKETIAYNGYRIPVRKCKTFKSLFLHLGEYRKRFDEVKNAYHYYQGKYGNPGSGLYMPLPEEYRKYVEGIKKPNVPK
jgi:glycosyltransferase involved in cell wall biosynthesis